MSLLTDCVAAAGLRGVPEEYEQIARRNDGTFRNITLNLDSAHNRGWVVNDQEFSPRLDQTWRRRYNKVVQRYPLAVYIYDAVELLRTLNLWLTPQMLAAITKRLLPGRGVRHWWQEWQLRRVLKYMVTTEQILKPKDGQIEAKKTPAVDVERYVPAILQRLSEMAKYYPTYAADECFDCGNALSDLGHHEAAIKSYNKALEFNSGDHKALYNRGLALFKLERTEAAIESYNKALEFKPDDYQAYNSLGLALSKLGRNKEAIESFDHAIDIKLDYYQAWFNRGLALSKLGRNKEAIESYDNALRCKPDYYQARNARGNALMQLEQLEAAQESFDRAVSIKPDYARAYYNKALCYALQKQIDLGIDALQRAITLDSKYRELAKQELEKAGAEFDFIRQNDRVQALLSDSLIAGIEP